MSLAYFVQGSAETINDERRNFKSRRKTIEPKLTSLCSLSDLMVCVGESGEVIVSGMQRQLRF
jgi:hypothetical protein